MTITELVERIGPENIRIQNVHDCMEGMDYSKKKCGVTMKLLTTEITCDEMLNDTFKKVGLILWFDKAIAERINAEDRVSE